VNVATSLVAVRGVRGGGRAVLHKPVAGSREKAIFHFDLALSSKRSAVVCRLHAANGCLGNTGAKATGAKVENFVVSRLLGFRALDAYHHPSVQQTQTALSRTTRKRHACAGVHRLGEHLDGRLLTLGEPAVLPLQTPSAAATNADGNLPGIDINWPLISWADVT
jgi:hypothetical protein